MPGTQTDGWVLNLNNRKDQVFAVRAVDRAHNTSALGVALSGAVGFKRVAVPINSSYSVVPLDVATSGDNIFVTFSERDANWTLQTGNLKVASSNDRGVSWRIATLDSAFGVGRVTGKIGVTDRAVVVATVGSSDPPDDSDQGEVRVYSSTDNGLSWSQLNNASLASSANFGSPSGVGVVASGDRLGVIYRQWDSAAIRVAYSSTGGAPSSIALAGSAMFTPSASVSDIKSCSGNYSAVHAWRKGANLDFVTQYFINFNTADTVSGTALSQTSVMSNFSTFDIACVSLPEATQTYVVAATTAVSSGSSHYLYLRRKLVASANFSGTQNLVSDVDDSVAPRVWAGGRNVFILYRNAAAQLTLMESSDEGQSFPAVNRAHLETNPNNGYGAVMSGENTQDVAVAYTDNTGSTLTVLLPAVPAVRSALTAGDGLARLSWTPVAGVDRYQVASGIDGGFSDFNYSSVVTYDVLPSSPTALTSFSVRAVDSKDMPGNDGYIWQAEPASTVVVHTDAGWSTGGSASGGLVAYNQSALLLPPFGNKGVGSNDLRVYRTQNGGQTWTASDTTYSGNATTDARALAGFGGRATVFSKLASFSGIYYSNQMLAGGGGWSGQLPSSTFIPSSGVAFVAAKADPTNSRVLVAYTHRDAGYISTALGLAESDGGITYYAQPTFPIYNPSAYELKELEIVKFDGNRAVVAMREKYTADNYESVYVTDSITVDRWDGGMTWNTPTFVRGGYNNYVSPAPSSYDVVDSGTQLAGAGNSAYSVVAFSSNDNLLNRHSGNLYVSVTGTDVASSGFTTLALDHDKLDDSSISAFSNGDGHYITYTGDDVVSSQNRLKLAYCPFDCHLINSWRRSILSTVGTKYASKFTVAQTTAGNTPLYYVTYVTNAPGGGWELRVLRGGVHRLSR